MRVSLIGECLSDRLNGAAGLCRRQRMHGIVYIALGRLRKRIFEEIYGKDKERGDVRLRGLPALAPSEY